MGDATKSVVVVCGDPGGANAMAPVLECMEAEGHVTAKAFAYREARSLWGRRGLTFTEIAEGTTEREASALLSEGPADALLVGTSVNSIDLEKQFVAAARGLGTPSLALLDFWSNYVDRFGDAMGALSYLPDIIAVMDEQARIEMIEAGFPPASLVITGQPAFDALPSEQTGFTRADRERVRTELGVSPDALLVAFASQPLAGYYGSDPGSPAYLGFTEHEVLAALVGALHRASARGLRVVLAVLPHPREDPRSFDGLSSGMVATVVSDRVPSRQVAMASDLVVGMNSILLVEACYLGCPTLSLQPGLRRHDPLPTNRMGFSKAVYDAAAIDSAVADLLLDSGARNRLLERVSHFRVDVGATRRIVDLTYAFCDSGEAWDREAP